MSACEREGLNYVFACTFAHEYVRVSTFYVYRKYEKESYMREGRLRKVACVAACVAVRCNACFSAWQVCCSVWQIEVTCEKDD